MQIEVLLAPVNDLSDPNLYIGGHLSTQVFWQEALAESEVVLTPSQASQTVADLLDQTLGCLRAQIQPGLFGPIAGVVDDLELVVALIPKLEIA